MLVAKRPSLFLAQLDVKARKYAGAITTDKGSRSSIQSQRARRARPIGSNPKKVLNDMTTKSPNHAVEEERRLDELIEHPMQNLYNDELGKQGLMSLAADIKLNGLREKIQILPANNKAGHPPNTTLDGRQRTKALLLNGETKTTVIVRYDLREADALTIEKVFLEFNAHRQHRDQLLQARTALRLFELEKKRSRGELRPWDEGEARDRVGKTIGMSGRNLNRYFRLLKTPVEVQNAHRKGKLQLVVAEKVADLDAKTQQKVAERIRDGEDPKRVVSEYLPTREARHRKVADAVASLVRGLERGRQDLDGRVDEVRPGHVAPHLEELRQAKVMIAMLIKKSEK